MKPISGEVVNAIGAAPLQRPMCSGFRLAAMPGRSPFSRASWLKKDGVPCLKSTNQVHEYAKSSFSIFTLASLGGSLLIERLRNSRESDGNRVFVIMLSIIRPPVSGSLHFDT